MSTFLITGGAGFIGGNFCNTIVPLYPKDRFICLDKLTYAGNLETISPALKLVNFAFIQGDICSEKTVDKIFRENQIDFVINFAAESHVDTSIKNPLLFTRTNYFGTQVLLEACRKYGVRRFHQVSTDEVYGELPVGVKAFAEDSPLFPSNPYAASKAAADLLVLSYKRTYKLPVTISRSCNNYGPFQNPEKFIPSVINKALRSKMISIYGDGNNERTWLHVTDNCTAIDLIVRKGKEGEIYNIGTSDTLSNNATADKILTSLSKPSSLLSYVDDRPGHDLSYALNCHKIEDELKWKPTVVLSSGLEETIKWYKENQDWVELVEKRLDEKKQSN